MNVTNRRWAAAGLIAATSAVLAVTGCTVNGSPGAGSSSAASAPGSATPADARQAFAASLAPLSDTPFHVTVTGGTLTGAGDVDPTQKNMRMALMVTQTNGSNPVKVNVLTVGDQMWLKLDLTGTKTPDAAALSAKWLHVDTARLGPQSRAGIASGTGPVDTTKLADAVSNVQRVDATHYSGTIDLTRDASPGIQQGTIDALGDKAKAIPFQATVDGQNRLTQLQITIPAVGDQPQQVITTTYGAYGTPVTVTPPPASQVVQAPSFIYQLFKA